MENRLCRITMLCLGMAIAPLYISPLMAAESATLSATLSATPSIPPEIPDPSALKAFKEYWSAFEAYEDRLLDEGQKNFKKAWAEIKSDYRKEQKKIAIIERSELQKAAKKYRRHLDEHPDADNRPFVMLNLAQIMNMIGDQMNKEEESAGNFAKNEALGLLSELERNYKAFSEREKGQYLRAIILESMDRVDEAVAVWKGLAATAKSTIYGVHAHVALGDYYFNRERAADATVSYKKALDLLLDIETSDAAYEKLRINYRLAWAAYRAAELDTSLTATVELLRPEHRTRSADQRSKIQQDAIDLAGDSLYESGSVEKAKSVLIREDLRAYGAAIGLRALKRYNANSIFSEATELGEFLIEEFPLAKEAPEILQVTADSWSKLRKDNQRLAALEKLSLLLPAQSLWRSRHKEDFAATKSMEEKAVDASVVSATANYERGLAAGNINAFLSAAATYESLLEFSANAESSNDWRLKRANCYFFAGRYDEAAEQYTDLKTKYKVDPATLQIASYQLVLTNEKRWRDAFAKAAEKNTNPLEDDVTLTALKDLEQSIDEFAARFPGQSRSIDLLLVGASANRDMERFENAGRYWQRALVSQPSAAQRGMAIRGLIFAQMKNGSSGDVVELAKRFLKLEDWKSLGLGLSTELNGVLSTAALDEGRRLGDNGKMLQAGQLMTRIAKEFPDLPERDRIYRDGAYMLAIAGDWAGAQKGAEEYLATNLQRNRADMLYLLARAHEYQIRLHDSANSYFQLAEKYPSHPRTVTSAKRAETLAVAEGDYALAAQAAALQAERSQDKASRLANYSRAVDYLEKAKSPDKALTIAQKRLKSSSSLAEQYRSQLLVAQMTYKKGQEQEALDQMVILSKRLEKTRDRLSEEEYAQIGGEVYVLLGEEARKQFEDFQLSERGGSLNANITQKSKYFDALVSSYEKAIKAGYPLWAAEGRYQIGLSAERLADEIATSTAKANQSLSLTASNRMATRIERLQTIAKKYHGSNILAARKNPSGYKDNEWVKKSAMRLGGEKSEKIELKRQEQLPTAYQADLPSQWSL
jgi:tetratricopeptide (TPR) repeat protein